MRSSFREHINTRTSTDAQRASRLASPAGIMRKNPSDENKRALRKADGRSLILYGRAVRAKHPATGDGAYSVIGSHRASRVPLFRLERSVGPPQCSSSQGSCLLPFRWRRARSPICGLHGGHGLLRENAPPMCWSQQPGRLLQADGPRDRRRRCGDLVGRSTAGPAGDCCGRVVAGGFSARASPFHSIRRLQATARSAPSASVQSADLIPRDALVCRGVPCHPERAGIMRERIVTLLGLTLSLTTLIC
jgi:hypothetical protein